MTYVMLYGFLGKKYGKRFSLNVKTPAEAVRALSAQFKSFRKDVAAYAPGYHVFVGNTNIGEVELQMPTSKGVIKFVPKIEGAKAGVLQTILGVVLIIVGAVTSAYGGEFLITAGISMVLGGIVQMLTSTPKSKSSDDKGNLTSYNFNGPVNTTAQGNPVPYLAGEMEIGSAVISAGIYLGTAVTGSVDVPPTTPPDPDAPPASAGDGATTAQPVFGSEGGG